MFLCKGAQKTFCIRFLHVFLFTYQFVCFTGRLDAIVVICQTLKELQIPEILTWINPGVLLIRRINFPHFLYITHILFFLF